VVTLHSVMDVDGQQHRCFKKNLHYSYNMNYMNDEDFDMKVTTADFIKNYGTLADKALSEPVTITKNGRDRLVVLSADEYARLKRRDRRVVRLEDFTDKEMALIATTEVPADDTHLDDELKDWKP
jgi:hypothetical protein